jgi:hypothetical protein
VPLKDSLNANLAKWDRKKMPRGNLEAVLGIEFPPPKVCRHSHYIFHIPDDIPAYLDGGAEH